jgi:hypothetical protein
MQNTFCVPPEQEMALNAGDKKWLTEEIATQVAVAVDALRPRGWQKFVCWLREWGLVGTNFAVILTLLGLTLTSAYYAFTRVSKEASFEGTTEQRLKIVESEIEKIDDELTTENIANQAALPIPNLRASLPELHASLATARQKNLKVPDSVLGELSNKLASIETNEPTFWPVAASLISYRSFVLVGTPQGWEAFPPCPGMADLDASPGATVQANTPEGKPTGPKVPIQRIGNQDCTIQLDGKRGSRWDCTHCVVKYSGGPVSLHDVHFTDCLFIFDLPQNRAPAPSGQLFAQDLLGSDLKNVEIKST